MPTLWGKKLPICNKASSAQNIKCLVKCLAKFFQNQAQEAVLETYLGKNLDLKQDCSILNLESAFPRTTDGNT